MTKEIEKNNPSNSRAGENVLAEAFPKLAGSHPPYMNNPALEFCKFVCFVMQLDKSVFDSVHKLKLNLMTHLKVAPFSEQATFRNPCLTHIVPDVICEYCHESRDLDLCRDPSLLRQPGNSPSDPDVPSSWLCPICLHSLDKWRVEFTLVQLAIQKSAAYQVQDLVCVNCNQVKQTNINLSCNCSGVFTTRYSAKVTERSLRALQLIAEYHDFKWLKETVQTILRS